MAAIVLVGIGSRASGDDAVGLVLAEQVARALAGRDETLAAGQMSVLGAGQMSADEHGVAVEVWEDRDALDVAAGLVELGERAAGARVLLVDCADMGLAPGCWRCFDVDDAELARHPGRASVHGVGLADGLALARALGFDNPVRVFGVQPFSVEPGTLSLSLPMATRLPSLGAALADELAVLTQRAHPSDGEALVIEWDAIEIDALGEHRDGRLTHVTAAGARRIGRLGAARRLFDAAAVALGLGVARGARGAPARARLEAAARRWRGRAPRIAARVARAGDQIDVDWRPLMSALSAPRWPAEALALSFHRALADALVAAVMAARAELGPLPLRLTGAAFDDALLVAMVRGALEDAGVAVEVDSGDAVVDRRTGRVG